MVLKSSPLDKKEKKTAAVDGLDDTLLMSEAIHQAAYP